MSLIALLRTKQCGVKYDQDFDPDWSDEELLSHVIKLNCYNRNVTSLPNLPNCQSLYCHYNRLTSLPDLPNCTELYCPDNQLTILPDLPNCRILHCHNNQLPFDRLDQWKTIWKARQTYLSSKYFRLWYLRMIQIKAMKKQKLHLELLWSPETKFYQEREEYRHFLSTQSRNPGN